jgi:hypothetical protein
MTPYQLETLRLRAAGLNQANQRIENQASQYAQNQLVSGAVLGAQSYPPQYQGATSTTGGNTFITIGPQGQVQTGPPPGQANKPKGALEQAPPGTSNGPITNKRTGQKGIVKDGWIYPVQAQQSTGFGQF